MTLHILADENIPAVEQYAGDLATVQRFSGRNLRPGQLAGVDVLLVRSVTAVNEALLAGSDIGFVGTATSGVDHIDREYLCDRNIGFSHAPGSNANSVVEYVLAAIAASGDHLEQVFSGIPVGIVGYGTIGRALAARLKSLGINFRAYDPWLAPGEIEQPAELAEILACGVVTLHAELTRQQPWPSYHLLDQAALALVSSRSLLINASRGPVVDNTALSGLLAAGRGPRVVLDVWEGEPKINATLLEQVQLGTPHIAGYSLDGKLLATRMLIAAMARYLDLPWNDPGSVAQDAPALEIPGGIGGATLLRSVLAQRYDITMDDAALRRGTLGASPGAAGEAFDRLRREYPERREVLGSRVSPGPLAAEAADLLAALGCRMAGAMP